MSSTFGGDGTPEEQAERIAAQREAMLDLGRALQPATGRMMTLEAARHTSAYLEVHEGLFYFNQLSQSRRADVLDLVQSYPLDAPFSLNGTTEEDVEYLEQLAAAIADHGCPAEWSICPEHGNWLRSSGGQTRCDMIGCDRVWKWDRLDAVCGRRLTHTLTTPNDTKPMPMCTVHADDARVRVDNVTITPLSEEA